MDNEIINADCMQELDKLEEGRFDLIVLDPDYNDWDKLCEQGLIEKCMRVLKDTGNMVLFTKQPFDYNLRIKVNPWFRREICWTFENGGAWVSKRLPLVSFQKIYWLVKDSRKSHFNPRTGLSYNEKTKDFKRSTKVFEGYYAEGREFVKSEEGCWMRDHYHYNKPQMGRIPAKPLELVEILVRCLCPERGEVLDPFTGSGTTSIACLNNERRFLGFEKNPECFEIANGRIEELFI